MRSRLAQWAFALAMGVMLAAAGAAPAASTQTNMASKIQTDAAPKSETNAAPRILSSAAPKAQTNTAPAIDPRAAEEKALCMENLKVIYQAIQAYQAEHLDLPNWLSDLVPKYLADANVLVCPVCRRTGRTEQDGLTDPKISSSYLFEFCPVPLGNAATNAPSRTRREWKRRQMGLVGSAVPLVRCRHHSPVLNLAFDGRIYESSGMWELTVTNRVTLANLSPNVLFPPPGPGNGKNPGARGYPPRDPKAPKELLNLTSWYNAKLTEAWLGKGETLAPLPTGVQTFAGGQFDVRGLIQLGGKSNAVPRFPAQVQGLKVKQKCQRLQFLHAAAMGGAEEEGKQIGTYVVHFATYNMRLEIPIVYGQDVRNWHASANEPPPEKDLTVAWKGDTGSGKPAERSARLFLTTWTNPAPNVEIESIDFVSSTRPVTPFLVAITAENRKTK